MRIDELFMKHVWLETQQTSPMKKEIKSEANHQSVGFHLDCRALVDDLRGVGLVVVFFWEGFHDGFEKKDMSFIINYSGFVWQEVGLLFVVLVMSCLV